VILCSILGHVLRINAVRIRRSTPQFIPTGELRVIPDTKFDFRRPMAIGSRIGGGGPAADAWPCVRPSLGAQRCSCLDKVAVLTFPDNGGVGVREPQIGLSVLSRQRYGWQAYGQRKRVWLPGLCLETQTLFGFTASAGIPKHHAAPRRNLCGTHLAAFSISEGRGDTKRGALSLPLKIA
jgi:hypothetical protein